MSDPISPTLHISLIFTCPGCEHIFDFLDTVPCSDELGDILGEVLPQSDWSCAHEKFERDINCPECGKDITLKGVNW